MKRSKHGESKRSTGAARGQEVKNSKHEEVKRPKYEEGKRSRAARRGHKVKSAKREEVKRSKHEGRGQEDKRCIARSRGQSMKR